MANDGTAGSLQPLTPSWLASQLLSCLVWWNPWAFLHQTAAHLWLGQVLLWLKYLLGCLLCGRLSQLQSYGAYVSCALHQARTCCPGMRCRILASCIFLRCSPRDSHHWFIQGTAIESCLMHSCILFSCCHMLLQNCVTGVHMIGPALIVPVYCSRSQLRAAEAYSSPVEIVIEQYCHFVFWHRFMAVSTENLHLMDGAMLSRTLRTLVRLGQKPNADWLLLLVEESYYHLSLLQPQHLADFAWSFGQLRYSPGPSWISRVLEAASHQLPGFKSAALVRLLQGLAGLQLKPGVEWLGAVGYRVQQLLGEMTAQELLQSVAALERLGSGPGALLMQQLSAGSFKSAAAPQPLAQTAVGSGGVRSSQVPSSPPPAVPEGVASDGASADVPAGAAVCAVPAEDHASAGSMQVIMRPQLQQQRAAVAAELAVVSASTREAQQITPHCTSPETTAANSSIASQLQRLAQQDGLEQGAYRLEADFAAELAAGSLRRSPDDWLDLALAGVGVEEQMGHSQNQAVILLPRPERPRRAPSGLQRPLAACR